MKHRIFSLMLATGLTLTLTGVGQAALLSYQGTFQVDVSPFPGELDIGDTFSFSFTYDDTLTDTRASTSSGRFDNALTAFTLTRVSGTGSWNPAAGTFSLPANVVTSNQTVQVGKVFGTGFPDLGGQPFNGLALSFEGGFTITDTGSGQTVAQQLGGSLPGTLGAFTAASFFTDNDFDTASGSLTSFSAVPAPSAMMLMSTGLLGLLGWRKWGARDT